MKKKWEEEQKEDEEEEEEEDKEEEEEWRRRLEFYTYIRSMVKETLCVHKVAIVPSMSCIV